MRHEDLLKIYSLFSIDGIGPGTIFLLSQHYNSPEDIFNATYPSLLKIKGISEILAKKLYLPVRLILKYGTISIVNLSSFRN